jgi:predicted nucleotidyltransferase
MRGETVRRGAPLPADIDARIHTLGDLFSRAPNVVFAYLFGGLATGRRTALSDVDLAVFVTGAEPSEAIDEVLRRVISHLCTDSVDLVILNTAPTALVGRVLQTRRVLFDRDPFTRHAFESLAARQFADFREVERRVLNRRYKHG